jgi:hypothetical protein
MSISLQCTACGKQYRLREALAGKRVKCGCGESMAIPSAAPRLHEIQDDDPGDDLLDESIWDPPLGSTPAEDAAPAQPQRSVSESPPVERPAPKKVDRAPAPGVSLPGAEAETASDTPQEALPALAARRRIAIPRRTLMANLAIGYGGVMTLYLVITMLVGGIGYYRLAHVALTAAMAVGGLRLRKGHAQGSTVIGLACAGVFLVSGVSDLVAFLWDLATIVCAIFVGWLPGQAGATLLSFAIVTVKAVLVYPIPICLVRWSLKEERATLEREERDDFYTIRDRISEEMARARERERQGR